MKSVILNGDKINSESDFHREISSLLNFGPYYGENLDALWDRLRYDIEGPVLLIWEQSAYSKKQLGEVFITIIKLLKWLKNKILN